MLMQNAPEYQRGETSADPSRMIYWLDVATGVNDVIEECKLSLRWFRAVREQETSLCRCCESRMVSSEAAWGHQQPFSPALPK